MRVTLNDVSNINIEGIKDGEIQSFIDMVKGTALQERRVWFPVMRELTDKPFNEIPFADKFVLAKEVKKMRGLQSQYFKTRSQDVLKASIAQERKVDELVNNILNIL